mmetsp:Transcript_78991/g.109456  ORF Transcript_78991/g.109456 Transcript_78991/m.109456 type:complete len:88 (+) Transcript_78991:422-685(+)
MPPIIKFLGDKKFICGEDVSYVDFFMYELLDNLAFVTDGKPWQMEKVKAYFERIAALPKLAEYIASGEQSKKAFSGLPAKINNKQPE